MLSVVLESTLDRSASLSYAKIGSVIRKSVPNESLLTRSSAVNFAVYGEFLPSKIVSTIILSITVDLPEPGSPKKTKNFSKMLF